LNNERIKITKKTNVSGSNFKSNTLILFDSIFTYIRKHRTINNILRLKIREGKNEIEKKYIYYTYLLPTAAWRLMMSSSS
jgi:hypothetical protein